MRKLPSVFIRSGVDPGADAALELDSIRRDELAVIADAAAGDACVAISVLRNAVEQASREGLD